MTLPLTYKYLYLGLQKPHKAKEEIIQAEDVPFLTKTSGMEYTNVCV